MRGVIYEAGNIDFLSEWLLFNATWSMCQLSHNENKLCFDEMMVLSALY